MAVRYRELLEAVSRMTGQDPGVSRAAAEATLTALARRLGGEDRTRLLDALPAELRDDFPTAGEPRPFDVTGFVREVSLLSRRPGWQARQRAQAVLAALRDQEPDLVAGLPVPDNARELFEPPHAGGGITAERGHVAPLTGDELADALRDLPYWTGDRHALTRTIELPEPNLERVLARIAALREEVGRAPAVYRRDGTARLVVRTDSVDAVTSLDVDLAARTDAAIDEAGAGMAQPGESRR